MKLFLCVSTHWDREWHEPFQEFRRWLVDLVDELMDILEKHPDFRCFHLDGQAVVLEDYLAIRPEQKDRLIGLINEGRIAVGPWYDLPDEWLVSGESLIRNLQKGIRTCESLGVKPMCFLFTPDQFGHIAALPTISAGFDIGAGICWRGTQDETHAPQFMWIGPDGSRQATIKLPDRTGYAEFLVEVRAPAALSTELTDESLKQAFDPMLERIKNTSPAPVYMMLDGNDHQRPPVQLIDIMNRLERLYPAEEFAWGSLEEYGQELLAHAEKLPEFQGELREVKREKNRNAQYLIVHTLSSRYPIKRRNGECQALLEKWAEPCALFEAMAGGSPIPGFLDHAWTYLLKNHPHDSICGCSIDQVHRDMLYRFDQSALLGEGIIRRSFTHIGKAAATDNAQQKLVVHNALPLRRREVVELAVPFKADWPEKLCDGLTSCERTNRFKLQTRKGKEIPYQVLRIDRGATFTQMNSESRGVPRTADIYHVAAELDLPSCGYTGIEVVATDQAIRTFGSQMVGPMAASNGLLSFALHSDGTGTLVHEPTGREFTDLFMYDDCGDSGDGWTRGVLINDVVFRSPGSRVTCAIEEDGPLRTVFRVERELDLPRQMDRRTYWRSDDRIPLRIVDRYTLDKGASFLKVHTTVHNTVRDHRLRVLLPTDVDAKVSFADSPFAVVERAIITPKEAAHMEERINPEKPMTSFCGVQDDEGGLAVLAPFGPNEYAVLETPERSLAITLYRSTFQTVNTSGEIGGELLQTMEFDYCLFPFGGPLDVQEVVQLVATQQAPVRMHHTEEVPENHSFLHLENDAVLVTALKPAHDGRGGIIRLWNPWESEVKEVIRLSVKVTRATMCNLNEDEKQDLRLDKQGGIAVNIPAKGLTTVRFEW
jgi:alpha-mannosidase/mannosylglycerate hydrolase